MAKYRKLASGNLKFGRKQDKIDHLISDMEPKSNDFRLKPKDLTKFSKFFEFVSISFRYLVIFVNFNILNPRI